MTKWLETLALITLAVILRLLVNFLFPEIPYWGRFFTDNNFGSLGNRLPILYEKKIT